MKKSKFYFKPIITFVMACTLSLLFSFTCLASFEEWKESDNLAEDVYKDEDGTYKPTDADDSKWSGDIVISGEEGGGGAGVTSGEKDTSGSTSKEEENAGA